MIYTLTVSPAIDYQITCNDVEVGKINKASHAVYVAGGKGINVSKALKNFGVNSIALGFVGGFTGDCIINLLDNRNIKHDFVSIEGTTRINVKVETSHETAFNLDGPKIKEEELIELYKKLSKLNSKDILFICGSVGRLDVSFYKNIMEELNKKNVKIILDTSGEALKLGIEEHPFLIKPNEDELNELAGRKLETTEAIIAYAKKLCVENDIKYVLVSLGAKGALIVSKDECYVQGTLDNDFVVRNTVGAGDSTLAMFISAYLDNDDIETCLRKAVASGCACVFKGRIPTSEDVEEILGRFSTEL